MIVYDFHVFRAGFGPAKADAVLIIDPDTVLAPPIPLQNLESVSGWDPQILERACGIQGVESLAYLAPKLTREQSPGRFRVTAEEEILSTAASEASDHIA